MATQGTRLTTGLPKLDRVLKGLLPGDNIVWQVDSIEDYALLVKPYCEAASRTGRKLIYFRFASHPPVVPPECGAEIYELNPEDGFESFIASIHREIEKAGRGTFYVFDCLSELAGDWYSDQMLGNFFMLTCPYLFDLETITYFALFRNHHSSHATNPIAETTQLLLEVLRHNSSLYIRPIKVQHRHSPTMNMLHKWEGDDFKPVTSSAFIAEILAASWGRGIEANDVMDFFGRTLLDAHNTLKEKPSDRDRKEKSGAIFDHLCRMIISRDPKILQLISKYLTLNDVLEIANRMIGTGLIGGKAVGMLLARAILKKTEAKFASLLEEHDSFYIGSDTFYTFLVRNGVWWVRQKQRHPKTFLEGSEEARRRILTGKFPEYMIHQFEKMLDYFGQSPFIVRSSSLLEDNFGNSFAGKYESVFCANQGPRETRLENFLAAVRSIYASTMSEGALRYRAQRGLLDQDEQMALLVMRVSGSMQGHDFYPAIAGVGFSFNPYVWSKEIDPNAGVLRIVFGLGTRAVNRSDDDYTRIIALNAPNRRPESNFDEIRQYAQRKVDYLDLNANQLVSGDFVDVLSHRPDLPMDLFASADRSDNEGHGPRPKILTFEKLVSKTDFVKEMREVLSTLHAAYNYPVDIEFTANFFEENRHKINLLQCRPLQVQGIETIHMAPIDVADSDLIIKARGAVVGQSRVRHIDRFIYVVPSLYGQLPVSNRYEIARLIGEINHALPTTPSETVMLLGPGRWGTQSPELGIPVSFPEINRIAILCEIVAMREGLVPDVSLGTHFLNELVEMDMLYLALFPKQGDNYLNASFFENAPNQILQWTPHAEKFASIVRVIETRGLTGADRNITLYANAPEQKVICYRASNQNQAPKSP